MKRLGLTGIILLTLVSCGKRNKSSSSTSTVIESISISSANVANCNMQAVRRNCTYSFKGSQLMERYELYTNYCWNRYNECLGR